MRSVALLLLCVLLLAGCGESLEKKLAGTWKVDVSKSSVTGDKIKSDAEKKMAMAMLSTVSVTLKEDKTFSMTVVFPIEGTWRLDGNKLTLTPTTKPGENISFGGQSTMVYEIDSTGSSMSSTMEENGVKGNLTLVKDAAK